MAPPSFSALYLAFPIVLGIHNWDEYTQARSGHPAAPSGRFGGETARTAMILLTATSALVATFNYITPTQALALVAELSVFALLFNAVGHNLLSMRYRAWMPGSRSATFLVLPYTIAALGTLTHRPGATVRSLWPLAAGGLVALPAIILVAFAVSKGAHKLISSR